MGPRPGTQEAFKRYLRQRPEGANDFANDPKDDQATGVGEGEPKHYEMTSLMRSFAFSVMDANLRPWTSPVTE
jgi:hypothetical protein